MDDAMRELDAQADDSVFQIDKSKLCRVVVESHPFCRQGGIFVVPGTGRIGYLDARDDIEHTPVLMVNSLVAEGAQLLARFPLGHRIVFGDMVSDWRGMLHTAILPCRGLLDSRRSCQVEMLGCVRVNETLTRAICRLQNRLEQPHSTRSLAVYAEIDRTAAVAAKESRSSRCS